MRLLQPQLGTTANSSLIVFVTFPVSSYETKTGILLYKGQFEKPLLEATYSFYHRESTQILSEKGVLEYMEWVRQSTTDLLRNDC